METTRRGKERRWEGQVGRGGGRELKVTGNSVDENHWSGTGHLQFRGGGG